MKAAVSHAEAVCSPSEPGEAVAGLAIGRLVSVEEDGRIFVTTRKGPQLPILARVSSTLDQASLLEAVSSQASVLLLADEQGPVVIGLVSDKLRVADLVPEKRAAEAPGPAVQEHVTLEAAQELTLRCGPSSITLRQDGRVIIRGVNLLVRARQAAKFRGATVSIN